MWAAQPIRSDSHKPSKSSNTPASRRQAAGKPPEDLTQEELEAAMDDLGIEEQDLTAADQAAIEAEAVNASPQSPTPVQPTSPAPSSGGAPDYIAELERLADLRDRGIITAEEFEAKKRQLLGL